jgi:transforming growth factor-beta-induced protein
MTRPFFSCFYVFLLSFLPTKIIFFFSFEIRQVITVNGARVVKPDIEATNGVIHIVDRVLFPVPQADIYNTLKTDPQQRYTTLISAIDRAGLTAVLANPTGNFPFFLRSFSLFQQG